MKEKITFRSPLSQFFELHLKKCESELAESSFKARVKHLLDFDEFLVSNSWTTDQPLDEKLMTKWLSHLSDRSSSTIMTYSNSIRMFLRFYIAITNQHAFIPPIYKVTYDYVPYIFDDEEMKKIYERVDNYPYGASLSLPYINLEFPTVIRLLEAGGFRLNELITVKMTEVDLENGVLKMVRTKRRKERYVPLSQSAAELLKQYCSAMNLKPNTDVCLFPRKNLKEPLKLKDIGSRFRKVLVHVGIRTKGSHNHKRGPCVHCLRHRFTLKAVKKLLENNLEVNDIIPYLSIYLGHKSFYETEMYMKFYAELFPEELKKYENYAKSVMPDEEIWDYWMG